MFLIHSSRFICDIYCSSIFDIIIVMNIEKELNNEQYLAVTSNAKHLRIIAGAGTGKTRTLTYRIAYLLSQGIPYNKIVAITFTNKVAREMNERVATLIKDDNINGLPFIATFHKFCLYFLHKEIRSPFTLNFGIADEDYQNDAFKTVFDLLGLNIDKNEKAQIKNIILSLKCKGIFYDEVIETDIPEFSFPYDLIVKVYSSYQKYLAEQNYLDFDDILMYTYKIMRDNLDIREKWQKRFSHYLVDEFQDTNDVQYSLLKLFVGNDNNLTVVGDPDQTIYTWRGANSNLIQTTLEKDYQDLTTIILNNNYRSTQSILDCSNMLINNNQSRIKKKLIAANNVVGNPVQYNTYQDEYNEAYYVCQKIMDIIKQGAEYKDIAILYRKNMQSRAIENKLLSSSIPYVIYGGISFYKRAEIKDGLAYLRLVINSDEMSFFRVINAPKIGIGEVTLNSARELCYKYNITIFDVFKNHRDELKLNKSTSYFLNRFFTAFDNFAAEYKSSSDISETIENYFKNTGFIGYVRNIDEQEKSKNFFENIASSRIDNVYELIKSVNDFLNNPYFDEQGVEKSPSLEDFLNEISLQTSQDEINDDNHVTLMTGHIAKGLEFPYVFIIGANQGNFPTFQAINSYDFALMEEERRLFYVCMTRAKKELYISSHFGFARNDSHFTPSIFIKEAGLQKPKKKITGTTTYLSTMGDKRRKILNNNIAHMNIKKKVSYNIGDKVSHIVFGSGIIEQINKDKLTIRFDKTGQVKIIASSFSGLSKVD